MQQMNDVKGDGIKGFVIGTSNVLFKHRTHLLWDVLIDVSVVINFIKRERRQSLSLMLHV